MKLWLDDIRPAPEGWTWVKTAREAFDILGNNPDVTEISLDHDLGEDQDSGYAIVETLERWAAYGGLDKYIPEEIHIHSANPVGRKNMQAAIDSINRFKGSDG